MSLDLESDSDLDGMPKSNPLLCSVASVDRSRLQNVFCSLSTSQRSLYGLSFDGFKKAVSYLRAKIESAEIKEIFLRHDKNSNGFLNFDEFQDALTRHKSWDDCCLTTPSRFKLNRNYDYTKSTNDNYGVEKGEFYGKFQSIRKTRDYDYHTNYIKARQQ